MGGKPGLKISLALIRLFLNCPCVFIIPLQYAE